MWEKEPRYVRSSLALNAHQIPFPGFMAAQLEDASSTPTQQQRCGPRHPTFIAGLRMGHAFATPYFLRDGGMPWLNSDLTGAWGRGAVDEGTHTCHPEEQLRSPHLRWAVKDCYVRNMFLCLSHQFCCLGAWVIAGVLRACSMLRNHSWRMQGKLLTLICWKIYEYQLYILKRPSIFIVNKLRY